MESNESNGHRKIIADPLRNDEYNDDSKPNNNDISSQPLYIPKHIFGNWYYVEDSIGRPYKVNFVNRCGNSKRNQDFEGIDIPPEDYNFHGKHLRIVVNNETSTTYLSVMDRYSCLCLDITKIKEEFNKSMKQEDFKMDNNNVNSDAVAARRRALAEALRSGEPVVVTASGEVEKKEDAQDQGLSGIQVPQGKLA